MRLLGAVICLWLGAFGLALMLAAGWADSDEFGRESVRVLTLGLYVPAPDVHADVPRLIVGFVLLAAAVVAGGRTTGRWTRKAPDRERPAA